MKPMNAVAWLLLPVLLGLAALPAPGFAQGRVPDLTEKSIEDLMNIEITSVSRKEQRVGDVAAAVSVITQEDIRRSGMTTVPELLRLVPGVQVARINSNKWAVSVRGFNNLFADKLLVLIDGRTVTTGSIPASSGSRWTFRSIRSSASKSYADQEAPRGAQMPSAA